MLCGVTKIETEIALINQDKVFFNGQKRILLLFIENFKKTSGKIVDATVAMFDKPVNFFLLVPVLFDVTELVVFPNVYIKPIFSKHADFVEAPKIVERVDLIVGRLSALWNE